MSHSSNDTEAPVIVSIADALIKSVRGAAVYNANVEVAPACILWPDRTNRINDAIRDGISDATVGDSLLVYLLRVIPLCIPLVLGNL
ncbi:hypothetical protein [Aporhodopirellula aestuarii]|uniref:Uncharacterized protein n=1 Tax=Aporhodopirellula aestuarii TaxID=2950107 RepID=A0ABT0U2I1_9BACT|nr:hypothetical protein [Aporhodopirellula aestuarii]MCM2371087.1 hypothetical protein [Aporhodopirellula aestuarii]